MYIDLIYNTQYINADTAKLSKRQIEIPLNYRLTIPLQIETEIFSFKNQTLINTSSLMYLWIVLYFTLEGFVFYLHLFFCMLFSGFPSNVPFNLFWLVRRLCFIFLNLCLQTEKKSFIKSKVNLYYALVLSYKNTNYSYLTMQWQQIGLANITHI